MDIITVEEASAAWMYIPAAILGLTILVGLINAAMRSKRDMEVFYVLAVAAALISALITIPSFFIMQESNKEQALTLKHNAHVEAVTDGTFIVYGEETFVVKLINVEGNQYQEVRL